MWYYFSQCSKQTPLPPALLSFATKLLERVVYTFIFLQHALTRFLTHHHSTKTALKVTKKLLIATCNGQSRSSSDMIYRERWKQLLIPSFFEHYSIDLSDSTVQEFPSDSKASPCLSVPFAGSFATSCLLMVEASGLRLETSSLAVITPLVISCHLTTSNFIYAPKMLN